MTADAKFGAPNAVAALERRLDELAGELAALKAERDAARAREAATSAILRVIARSPADVQPVFEVIVGRAAEVCAAEFSAVARFEDGLLHLVAVHSMSPQETAAFHALFPRPPLPNFAMGRAFIDARPAHVADALNEPGYDARTLEVLQSVARYRSFLGVPIVRDGKPVGVIGCGRREVKPFTEAQIALLQTFADQAVIAIENARLLTETREALEQQTATAEVLQVVNASPGDLAPVFDTILEKAMRLCAAAFGALHLYDGEYLRAAATHGVSEDVAALMRQPHRPPDFVAPLLQGRSLVHLADAIGVAGSEEAINRVTVERAGVRTLAVVPLRKDGALLGTISVFRQEVRPFSEAQIALLQSFAAQAVIAMENARLLRELRARTRDLEEALEYQTAVSDVLKVISGSAFDLEPVLQSVVSTAIRLCRADQAVIYRNVDGEYRWAAGESLTPDYERIEREVRIRPGTGTLVGRAASERRTVHILDCWADPRYEAKDDARIGGVHTMLGVPLLRDGQPIGVIGLARQRVEAFSEREIQLVTTFADQAVIAIENARLLTETREALEQQTATAEVLQVINSSPGDLAPVFDAILEKAHSLCDVAHGSLQLYDGEYLRAVATHGVPNAFADILRQGYRAAESPGSRGLLEGQRFVQIVDCAAIDHPVFQSAAELSGIRSVLFVPLRRDDTLLGLISSARREVRPFSESEITLLENFAAQAVIAMENARLINETREALQQQTATAEVLQVINSSPGDLAPVFQAILEKAHSLCEASFGALMIYDGERLLSIAHQGTPQPLREFLASGLRPRPEDPFGAIVNGAALSHIVDLLEIANTYPDQRLPRAAVELGGVRTLLIVPLRKDGALLGVITAYRQEVRPFTDKQIGLLQNFAAQAVIAMDNARLLDEIRQRQAELRVTFDNMGDGVAMFDAELRLAAWNTNFQKMLDLPASFLASRPHYDAYIRYLAERGEFGDADVEAELARRRDTTSAELRLERMRPDGRVLEVRRNAVPGGGFVLIYSDVTERKRAEAEIRAARDAAERALAELQTAQASLIHAEKMASLGQLTAGIAHEIKNPLNFVNNFAGLSVELLDEIKEMAAAGIATLDAETRAELDETLGLLTGNLEKIAEHGRRADGIVQSMLLHSRGGSGERRPVDLNELVEESLSLAYHGARAQDPDFNIVLERDFARPLAPVEVVPQDITRVLLNLIANGFYAARKRRATADDPSFAPRLKVTTRDGDDAVEVRVRDNGIGIPPELRDKLFQPFFTTKPTGEGTGLGLSISYDIVAQQHGGTIAVDSQPDLFTEFTVRLPRRRPA
jgi:GAF domain-containing protein